MRRSFFIRAGIGFLAGMVIGNVISIATGSTLRAGDVGWIILQTLMSGLLGGIAMGTTILYDLERWPLALVSAAHYLIIEAVYIPSALILGWVNDAVSLLIMIGIQLVIYLIIWLIMYLIYRKQVRELNEMSNRANQPDDTDNNGKGDKK